MAQKWHGPIFQKNSVNVMFFSFFSKTTLKISLNLGQNIVKITCRFAKGCTYKILCSRDFAYWRTSKRVKTTFWANYLQDSCDNWSDYSSEYYRASAKTGSQDFSLFSCSCNLQFGQYWPKFGPKIIFAHSFTSPGGSTTSLLVILVLFSKLTQGHI